MSLEVLVQQTTDENAPMHNRDTRQDSHVKEMFLLGRIKINNHRKQIPHLESWMSGILSA